LNLILLLVVLAAMTRRAQIPFSSWLPAAMAAPTPVSALVHSSTLVTAGVYLLIRFSPAFSGWLCTFLLLFSGLTIFMAGLGANFEYDLRKIIALSTLSQLGLMIGAVSVGLAGLAFFHLLTHALFRALLFMCAGVIIHTMRDSQDIRFMGNLSFQMPFTSVCLGVASFALCGIPFLAGFYSRDIILEMVSLSYVNWIGFFLFFASTGLTVCYSFRLFYYVFCGDFNLTSFYCINENNLNMLYGIVGLMVVAVFGGRILRWVILCTPSIVCLPFYLKLLTVFVSLVGGWVGFELSRVRLSSSLSSLIFYNSSSFFGSIWFIPYFSTFGVSSSPLLLGFYSLRTSDLG
jgi:NADH-ubiquinone oxidoreductase chain 5